MTQAAEDRSKVNDLMAEIEEYRAKPKRLFRTNDPRFSLWLPIEGYYGVPEPKEMGRYETTLTYPVLTGAFRDTHPSTRSDDKVTAGRQKAIAWKRRTDLQRIESASNPVKFNQELRLMA